MRGRWRDPAVWGLVGLIAFGVLGFALKAFGSDKADRVARMSTAASALSSNAELSNGMRWYNTGPGGGGWAFTAEFDDVNPNVIYLGADISGVSRSSDRGRTWVPWNDGMTLQLPGDVEYCQDIVAVGDTIYAATMGGLWRRHRSGGQPWDLMTDPADLNAPFRYTCQWTTYTSGTPVARVMGFSALAHDNGVLVAGAGAQRPYENTNWESQPYPNRHASGTVGYTQDTCPWGEYSVWIKRGEYWRPFYRFGNIGTVRDIDVVVTDGPDTLVAVTTPSGIYVYDSDVGDDVNFTTRTFHWGASTGTLSGLASPLTDTALWDVRLTPRRTMYVALRSFLTTAGRYESGVYRLHDVRASSATAQGQFFLAADVNYEYNGATYGWSTTNDHYAGLFRGGNVSSVSGTSQMLFFDVVPGSDTAADVIIAGDSASSRGIWKTSSPYNYTDPRTEVWQVLSWYTYPNVFHNLPIGWAKHGTAGNSCYVNALRIDTDQRIFAHVGTTAIVSYDGGTTWASASSFESAPSSDLWHHGGYDELCPWAVVELADGRLAYGSGDAGPWLQASNGYWEQILPNWCAGADTTTTGSTGGLTGIPGGGSCYWVGRHANFQASGREAILALTGTATTIRLMAYWDSDNDGDKEWQGLGHVLGDPNGDGSGADGLGEVGHMFRTAVVVGNDIYLPYQRRTTGGGTYWPSGTLFKSGVYRLRWSQSAPKNKWVTTDWSTGLPAGGGHTYYDIVYSPGTNRLFMAEDRVSGGATNGGVWYRKLDETESWTLGMTTSDDCRSVAVTPSGATVYAGTRGLSGYGDGTLYVASAKTPNSWTKLLNTTEANRLGWEQWPDMTGWTYGSAVSWAAERTTVAEIAVNPSDTTKVWIGVGGGHASNLQEPNGVYIIDRSDNSITRVDTGLTSAPSNPTVIRFTSGGQVVVGYQCNGLWIANMDGTKIPRLESLVAQ